MLACNAFFTIQSTQFLNQETYLEGNLSIDKDNLWVQFDWGTRVKHCMLLFLIRYPSRGVKTHPPSPSGFFSCLPFCRFAMPEYFLFPIPTLFSFPTPQKTLRFFRPIFEEIGN